MNQLKPITEHVCDMLRERSERGLAKYGTTIDRDDLSPAQWLQHLQEELLDAAQYVEALKRQSAPPAALAVPVNSATLNYVAGLLKLSDHHLTNGPHPIERDETYWKAQAAVAIGGVNECAMLAAAKGKDK
jgi:hypothetical protein